MPAATRLSTFSPNTNQASRAVNSASAFSSRDAPEAGMFASPNIISTGPTTPPERIAPANGHSSERESRTRGARRNNRMSHNPAPDPQ